MSRGRRRALGLLGALFLLALPHLLALEYYLHILVMAGIHAVLAVSLGLIIGFTGQVSLCHAAFYGIGAYASALAAMHLGWSFWITLWIGGAAAGLLSFGLGRLVLRWRGHFLAITTAFFGVLVTVVMNNWVPVTKGPMGIPGIPRPSLPAALGPLAGFESRVAYYYLMLAVVAAVWLLLGRLVRSRIGAALIAIRENEPLAQSIGVDTMAYKVLAFTLGGGLAGIAGALYAHYILFISPVTFTIGESINILVMVIFGGMTTLTGPILGAAVLTILPELLRMAGALRLIIYGAALMAFIIWMPLGIVGTLQERLAEARGRRGLAREEGGA